MKRAGKKNTMATIKELLAKTDSDVALKIEYITVEDASEETDSRTHIYRVKNTGQKVGMATEQGVEDYIIKKGVDVNKAELIYARY
jgi:hypothetical protein